MGHFFAGDVDHGWGGDFGVVGGEGGGLEAALPVVKGRGGEARGGTVGLESGAMVAQGGEVAGGGERFEG